MFVCLIWFITRRSEEQFARWDFFFFSVFLPSHRRLDFFVNPPWIPKIQFVILPSGYLTLPCKLEKGIWCHVKVTSSGWSALCSHNPFVRWHIGIFRRSYTLVSRGSQRVNSPTLLSQENQLNKLLHLTRMIAARLFQLRDRERALQLYSDVVATTLSLEEIRKLEGVSACRQRG